jgi:filamentous hemagglutinin
LKKKGGFGGSSQTKRDETTDVKNIGSEITTGGDLTLVSGGDQRYQGAKLESGNDLTLDSGGSITFEAVKDLHQESHEKSKGDLAWNSASGKGQTDETLRQSELIASGKTVINAVDGLHIDIKQIDQNTVSQTIDAMVQADPSLAWLKDAEARGDVNWQQVKEFHDSFKYSNSGLGAGAQLAIAILVTYLTWGAGSSLVGAAANSVGGAAANSVVAAVATKTATSTINNRGNLSDVAADVTSSDSLKNYAIAGVSGGVGTVNSIGMQLAVNTALKTVLQGGKFKDNLAEAAVMLAANVLSGYLYENVGNALNGSGLATKVAVHAIVGGLIAEAAGGDFRTAALAAGANEALLETFGSEIFPGDAHKLLLAMTSQLVGMTVAAAAGGNAKDQEKAGWVTQQAAAYNYLQHEEVDALSKELVGCRGNSDPVACRGQVQDKYQALNDSKTGAGLYGC